MAVKPRNEDEINQASHVLFRINDIIILVNG
jgi:hypothetical protein